MSKITILEEETGINISPTLYGVSIDDKYFACDGGLNANMVANYSFDEPNHLSDWRYCGGTIRSGEGIRGKSLYAKIYSEGEGILTNLGYNGNGKYMDVPAMGIVEGHTYVFSCDIRRVDYQGQIYVSIVNKSGRPIVKSRSLQIPNDTEWHGISVLLMASETMCGKLEIRFKGRGTVHLDLVRLYDKNSWGEGMDAWSCSRLRRDLVHAIGEMQPSFLRFPGGNAEDPPYNWKDYIGRLIDRKNDGIYSSQIGVYEYFCLCEDLGMEPAPMLWNEDPQDYLDLIEFARGDSSRDHWAMIRRDMGHPDPFVLKRMRVRDENIKNKILERYPDFIMLTSSTYFPSNGEVDDTLEAALNEAKNCTEMEMKGSERHRSSYISLLGMAEYGHSDSSLIIYNPLSVTHSANYYVQQLFASNLGKRTVKFDGYLPLGHYMSATADKDVVYIKYVNTGYYEERVTIECPRKVFASWGEVLTADAENARGSFAEEGALAARNMSSFNSSELEQVIVSDFSHKIKDNEIKFTASAYSLIVIRAELK
ncbi:MAG: hypothetical protein K6F00_09105 [Lachnospiraceae bacterium]|nr:hypothetical protein [Lachnospiraceae bacterium]